MEKPTITDIALTALAVEGAIITTLLAKTVKGGSHPGVNVAGAGGTTDPAPGEPSTGDGEDPNADK